MEEAAAAAAMVGGPGPGMGLRGGLMAVSGGSKVLAARYQELRARSAVGGCSRKASCAGELWE